MFFWRSRYRPRRWILKSLLFVYTTTYRKFVIFTCRYFKLSWNTTGLSQSNCRNFSCSSQWNYLLRCNDTQQQLHDLYNARQEYLSSGLRTAYQPSFTPLATLGFTVSFILQWTVYNTNNVWHVGKSLLNEMFVYNFYYTYFSKTNPRKNIYLCLAVLYKNTAVSFKSNITKIYYCWPPVLDAILFQKNICISDLLTILVCDICYNAR